MNYELWVMNWRAVKSKGWRVKSEEGRIKCEGLCELFNKSIIYEENGKKKKQDIGMWAKALVGDICSIHDLKVVANNF